MNLSEVWSAHVGSEERPASRTNSKVGRASSFVPEGFADSGLKFAQFPAQFLHSQKMPRYLQSKQSDIEVLSPRSG